MIVVLFEPFETCLASKTTQQDLKHKIPRCNLLLQLMRKNGLKSISTSMAGCRSTSLIGSGAPGFGILALRLQGLWKIH